MKAFFTYITGFDPAVETVWLRIKDSVRDWERGRLRFNIAQLLLTACAAPFFGSDARWFFTNIGTYLAAALVANIFYCFLYSAELIVQTRWLYPHRHAIRWCIIALITLGASYLSYLVLSTEIFVDPAVD